MSVYRIAGLSMDLRNIDYPYVLRRMEQYRGEDGSGGLLVDYRQQTEITAPTGELAGKKWGYRTYLKTEDGRWVNYDSLENTENRTALISFSPDFREAKAYLRDVEALGGAPIDVRCFNMMGEIFRMALTMGDGLVVHASSIACQGQGILFSAPPGTGKSTHTGLWRQCFGDSVTIVNDDTPAVTFRDGQPFIHGTPWSGKTEINENIEAPLRAVVFLKQDKKNQISRLDSQEAVFRLMREIFIYPYREMADKALQTADKLLRSTPCYLLGCRPDFEAVQLVKNTLQLGDRL